MSNPTADPILPENVCPEHLNDGVNVLICPICHAEQLYEYMQSLAQKALAGAADEPVDEIREAIEEARAADETTCKHDWKPLDLSGQFKTERCIKCGAQWVRESENGEGSR